MFLPESNKIALIDADTIAFASAVVFEIADEALPRHMYNDEEWEQLTSDEYWDEANLCTWVPDFDSALSACISRVEEIVKVTNTTGAELYFTSGKNFRFSVDPMYKANRSVSHYPVMLLELKEALLKEFEGEILTSIEADDAVVYLKRTRPDDYVLCAVDKDVYKSVPGKHYNYYRSEKHSIEPRWVEVTKEDAEVFPYIQTLTGDSTDNITGCPGVGIKGAIKALTGCTTTYDRWGVVLELFKKKKLSAKDAVRTMRLVNMHQCSLNKEGEWIWEPWTQPTQ